MTELLPAILAIATTLDLLPERLDLAGVVLTMSGLGALVGAFLAGLWRMEPRREMGPAAQQGALIGAGVALVLFVVLYLAQEVR